MGAPQFAWCPPFFKIQKYIMRKISIYCYLFFAGVLTLSAEENKLIGEPFGSPSWDYSIGAPSQSVNSASDAFDGDLSTFYASEARSLTYVGLDLKDKHVITKVGWSPRNDYYGPGRMVLGVFQGANSPDFMDAVPIYMITQEGVIGEMRYADVDCSRGFQYVRYVGPNDARCNIAEIEFYGYKDEGDDTRLFQLTNLPTVVINTENSQEPFDKETNINSNIIIINNNSIDTDAVGGVRERGNASRAFPKKPWRIKFDKKQQPLGAPAKAKKWTLINNYGDKTLMRNILGYEISNRMGMPYTPFIQPVDVIMNGEYKGCYQLCDQVELAEGRIEGIEMEKDDIDGETLTGAYHIEIDPYASQEISWFQSNRGIPVTIKSPDEEDITPEQYDYIKKQFNLMESSATGPMFLNSQKGYRNYIDTDSWFKYMLVEELIMNPDQLWSIHCLKPRNDEKFYVAAIWDLDLAFDNDIRFAGSHNYEGYLWQRLKGALSCGGSGDSQPLWDLYQTIMEKDAKSVEEIRQLWSNSRESKGISVDELIDFIEETEDYLQESQYINFLRWKILDTTVHNNYQALGSWEAEVDHLKEFIATRLPNLDDYIGYAPTTSVEAIEEGFKCGRIYSRDGVIYTIGFATGSRYTIYSISGQIVSSGCCEEPSAPLNKGTYIVRVGDKSAKIFVN